MKGIILASGSETWLHPAMKSISKRLLPVYDKPLIYCPLPVLMLASINEVLAISTPRDIPAFKSLLGDSTVFGIHIEYAAQDEPCGLAETFIIGRYFIGREPCALVLGDSMFHRQALTKVIPAAKEWIEHDGAAVVLGYPVKGSKAFGAVEFCGKGRQGYRVACIEGIAYRCGLIDAARLRELGEGMGKTDRGTHLISIADEGERE